jgi:nicotinamidase-related amidase
LIALLVIDMQNAYFENPLLQAQQADLVAACNTMIDAATTSGAPVVMVKTEHEKDKSTWTLSMLDDDQGFIFRGTEQAAFVPGLSVANLPQLIKTRDSAFLETGLTQRLRARDVDTVILAGVSGHNCIAQTGADAFAHNFRVIYAAEAIGTEDPESAESMLTILAKEYRQRRLDIDSIVELLAKP